MSNPAQEGILAGREENRRAASRHPDSPAETVAVYEVETQAGNTRTMIVDLRDLSLRDAYQEALAIETHLKERGGYRRAKLVGHYNGAAFYTPNEAREYRVMG